MGEMAELAMNEWMDHMESTPARAYKQKQWQTKEGVVIPITAMDESHVHNCLGMYRRRAADSASRIQALARTIEAYPLEGKEEVLALASIYDQVEKDLGVIEMFMEELERRKESKEPVRNRIKFLMGETVESPEEAIEGVVMA